MVDAHSLVLETAAELGLAGLFALALAVTGLAWGGLRGLEAAGHSAPAVALAGAFATFAFAAAIDWMWESTALAYLGIGSAVVLAMAASRPLERRRGLASRWRWSLAAAAVAVGALQIPGIVAAALVEDAEEQIDLGAPVSAIAFADDAVTAAPWAATPHATRGEASLAAGRLTEAAADAERAIVREPEEAAHRFLAARVAAALGDGEAAAAALTEAATLSPRSRLVHSRQALRLVRAIRALLGERADGALPLGIP